MATPEQTMWIQIAGAAVSSLGCAGSLWYGFNRMHKYRLIADTPTSKVRSLAMGLVEIKGNAVADVYLKAPFSQKDCVYYHYVIKEYRRHVTSDSKGRAQVHYSWDVVGSGERRMPFYGKDDTGKVLIRPDGAEFNIPCKQVFLQRNGLFGAIGAVIGALQSFDKKGSGKVDMNALRLEPIDEKKFALRMYGVGDRKYYEYYLTPEEPLYVLGTAENEGQTVAIKKGTNEPTFLISDKSEKELVKSLKWTMIGMFALGIGLAILAVYILLILIGIA
ncbi:hypothetical protein COV93_03625 [Candidatus Woesearchaeota archaeon CG11_big_fil_rev_8_21_14_0_20_43_8]|nr:MAG: hypothetical protein COV93_03625 [Candidatus Woesearchaeota archaeon CG11_big_fil_rev_8_21_14_0_20_43_8]PIO08898.1 MAG: hypothetical protein COT47_00725 [Candidatus Woesearchaeota archaeon CG08_land_8_20_14_0_20_43_7]